MVALLALAVAVALGALMGLKVFPKGESATTPTRSRRRASPTKDSVFQVMREGARPGIAWMTASSGMDGLVGREMEGLDGRELAGSGGSDVTSPAGGVTVIVSTRSFFGMFGREASTLFCNRI